MSKSVSISKFVNASLNFWGTTNLEEIAKTIYDVEYDDTLVDIISRPYLGSKNTSDVQDKDVSFLTGYEIGGQINGNITLPFNGSPYLAVSNIRVTKNDTLTTEASVVIYINRDIRMSVTGK